ncbi:hypothetical protein NP493_283g06003 [Ridgeia piscesae]|uniref:Eukaryotic translation initiation factor 5A n=1 Tax=Ridgeia piscesae TaxID=27915 RepID=A0AAD9UCD1_RIDPI|nr:hypothetical protein NP493_283g06003 [Ridgeia piscesae]
MADENDFESVASGAAETFPMQCSALRKNGYVVLKDRPCKIVDMSTSKTGKHGHAKVHLVGLDIFTGKKYEDICPSTHNMQVPHVKRTEYQVIDFTTENFFCLMDDAGETRDDLKFTELCTPAKVDDVKTMVTSAEENGQDVVATVWKAMGTEMVKELRAAKGN